MRFHPYLPLRPPNFLSDLALQSKTWPQSGGASLILPNFLRVSQFLLFEKFSSTGWCKRYSFIITKKPPEMNVQGQYRLMLVCTEMAYQHRVTSLITEFWADQVWENCHKTCREAMFTEVVELVARIILLSVIVLIFVT